MRNSIKVADPHNARLMLQSFQGTCLITTYPIYAIIHIIIPDLENVRSMPTNDTAIQYMRYFRLMINNEINIANDKKAALILGFSNIPADLANESSGPVMLLPL
jgi:hypothetical protein